MEKKAETMPMGKMPTAVAPVFTAPPVKHMEKHEMKKLCVEHLHRYVLVQTKDGWCCDGFVEHIDDEVVCIAVPHCEGQEYHSRAFFPYPPLYPYPLLYPYPYFPRRRFYRQVFPLAALLALSLLPFY